MGRTRGVSEKIETDTETTTPAAAFVATILDDASNIAPASDTAHVVAHTEATYRAAEIGNSIKISE